MAAKIDLVVGVDDQTKAGNARVEASAESTRQTLSEKHQKMLAEQQAAIDKFARDNSAAILNADDADHRQQVANFETLLARKAKLQERFAKEAAEAAKPLTESQTQAVEVARGIVGQPIAAKPSEQSGPVGFSPFAFKPNPEAEAAIEKLSAEVAEFQSRLEFAAIASDKLADELKTLDFPEESLNDAKALATQIEKTRQAALLAADAFDAMGQSDSGDRLRAGLAATEGATRRMRAAINQAGVDQLAAEMAKAGNTAQHMSGGLDKSGQAALRLKAALADMGIPKLTTEMNRVEAAARGAAGTRSASGQGIMQLAYAADDLQYGMRGIVNNIPSLLTGLGVGAGLAGVISIAAVAINVLLPKIEQLAEKLNKDGFAKTATDGVEALTQKYRKLEVTLKELAAPIQATNDAAANNQAGIDALKKEIAEYERLGAVKAAQKALGEGLKDNAEKAGERAAERAREELDTVAKVEARIKGLQAYIDQQGGNGLHAISPDSVEDIKRNVAELGKLQAQKERIAKADEKKAKEATDTKADADFKREADAREKELKSLDEIDARLREIDNLKKGKATGLSGAYDLDEKTLKRITAEEESLKNKRAFSSAAMAERLRENSRLATEFVEKSHEQSQELEKQAKLTNALHAIEQKRAAIASGSDDSIAESQRAQAESRRDSFLDRVKRKTDEARDASQKTDADESQSIGQRQAKREAYNVAVMSQITAEANVRKQKAAEQNVFEQSQIAKNASLDQAAVAIRQAMADDAKSALTKAREADQAADRDTTAGSEERRKKATAELAKAENAKLKADAELAKQIESNETRRKDTAEKNQQQHTKQRIADEIAIGKAREKALMDAAAREQAIEDAKQAKLQHGLQAAPQVKQVAEKIDAAIDDRRVVQQAIRDRQNKAENDFVAAKRDAGEAVKPEDVARVRAEAGRGFIKDNREGKADAELANIRKRFFDDFVDGARGLNDAQRAALKALAGEAANKIIEDAGVKNAANEIEKAKPQDKAAAKRNRTREEIEAEALVALNARRKARNLEPLEDREPNPADPRERPEPLPRKTMEQIKDEAAKKAAEQKRRRDEANAKRLATRKAAEEKKQREQDRKDAQVEANVADVQEKRRLDAETPDERAAREQREDDEFRQQRAKEEDERIAAEHARQVAEEQRKQPQAATEPLAANQSGQQVATAAQQLVAQTAKANSAKSQTDNEVLAALQKLTQLQTELANEQAAARDVVAQITDHVNGLQSQLVAQANSASTRALRAGAV